jgi:rubrerythrin
MNPYVGSFKQQLLGQDLLNAIRLDIMKEQDAIIFYEVHRKSSGDGRVTRILDEIISDEKQHVVLLTRLLELLDPQRELEAESEAMEELIQLNGLED